MIAIHPQNPRLGGGGGGTIAIGIDPGGYAPGAPYCGGGGGMGAAGGVAEGGVVARSAPHFTQNRSLPSR